MTNHIEVDGVRYVREDSPALLSADPDYFEPRESKDAVRCPGCGEATGLHINEVRLENAAGQKLVATSNSEDDGSRIHVSLTDDSEEKGRRYTLTLAGECEHCTTFELKFQQHKGMTFFTKTA
jgi:hypothetical protein